MNDLNDCPKGLTKINNRTIIERNLENINSVKEINKIIIVTNKMFKEQYDAHLKKLNFNYEIILNERVERGNGHSFYISHEGVSTMKFALIMSDHLFSKSFTRIASLGEGLAIDADPIYYDFDDATKVLVDSEGYVKDIGKNLSEFNYIDTGFFIFKKSIFNVIKEIVDERVKFGVSDIIKKARSKTVDVTGNFWMDIDTENDLLFARTHAKKYLTL